VEVSTALASAGNGCEHLPSGLPACWSAVQALTWTVSLQQYPEAMVVVPQVQLAATAPFGQRVGSEPPPVPAPVPAPAPAPAPALAPAPAPAPVAESEPEVHALARRATTHSETNPVRIELSFR
jgi:hypothetical protein